MADRQTRYPRRGGDRGAYNGPGRRDNHGRDDRPGRDNRDRDFDRDRRGDRDRGEERDRDHRRYRSRSRDRGGRRRSQSPRVNDRREERTRDRPELDKGYRSRRDEGRDSFKDRNTRGLDRNTRGNEKDRDIRSPASPLPPAGPKQHIQPSVEKDPASLPNRSKAPDTRPSAPTAPPAPVSFTVKAQDRREGSHGVEQRPRSRNHSQEFEDSRYHKHADEEAQSRGRFDNDPMDQDDDDDELVVEDDGLAAMQAMMGFGGFDTTKGKKIKGNNLGAVHKEKKTEYRQYMNRVGGFNRPLSPGR